jgi:hypothetical protein
VRGRKGSGWSVSLVSVFAGAVAVGAGIAAASAWSGGSPGVALVVSVAAVPIGVASGVLGGRRSQARFAAAVGLALATVAGAAWFVVLLWAALVQR